jgi:hypothetical protein
MLALCHCRNCQYISGGEPVAVAVAPAGSFKVTRGQLKAYWAVADSGRRVDRNFCPECGTHLANRLNAGSPFVAVPVATLDEALPLEPQMEVWAASARSWAHHPPGVASFEKNPG